MNTKYKYTLIFVLFLCCTIVSAQSFKKDSLQIKAYTEIEYKAGKPINITLKKVFCDYCSKTQLTLLGEDAIRRADGEKQNPKNKLVDGKKKLAVYIRIAKTDFASIKEEE
ncbi:hypothetical protein [Lacinutrix sp. Bg11-31]|uniref:hypothetical protein n=1 Tax=Lacinutrix sp. Bg11-31 TaxID=2057808 RepID=UPI000C2FFF8F|nr:hypothetical protein [Lacinutrix sp. Bg11-31]AUC81545.1 hypothetical protein CW733_05115 [Lacinutrix sp. Bg11-31]